MTTATDQADDYTPASALSLRALRAEMLTKAAVIAAQSRAQGRLGNVGRARALRHRAEELVRIARSIKV